MPLLLPCAPLIFAVIVNGALSNVALTLNPLLDELFELLCSSLTPDISIFSLADISKFFAAISVPIICTDLFFEFISIFFPVIELLFVLSS